MGKSLVRNKLIGKASTSSGSTPGTIVESVQGGISISVDSTDPANPIVNLDNDDPILVNILQDDGSGIIITSTTTNGLGRSMDLQAPNGILGLGDPDVLNLGTRIMINDITEEISYIGNKHLFEGAIDSQSGYLINSTDYNDGLLFVDGDVGQVYLGDFAGGVNNTFIQLDDTLETITYNASEGHIFNNIIQVSAIRDDISLANLDLLGRQLFGGGNMIARWDDQYNVAALEANNYLMHNNGYIYWGNQNTDGDWRIYINGGGQIIFERRDSGVWTNQGSFG